MKNQITIRPYTSKDKDKLLELIRLNTPKFFAPEEENDFSSYLDNERELYYVLVYQQEIVGCGGINFDANGTIGKISWDIFHPNYQGKSFGSKLLKYRIDVLQQINHVKKITVRTSQHTHKFYEKLGFKVEEISKDYWAKGFDLYAMSYSPKSDDL